MSENADSRDELDEIDQDDEEETTPALPVEAEGLQDYDDDDFDEPGDVHAPCPPPSETIGRNYVPMEPFPDGMEEAVFEDDGGEDGQDPAV